MLLRHAFALTDYYCWLGGDFYPRYDLVDLTRQCLSKLANEVYLDAMSSYQKKDSYGLNAHARKFLEIIVDIDTLLAADDNFLLGPWLESAKSLAITEKERQQVCYTCILLPPTSGS